MEIKELGYIVIWACSLTAMWVTLKGKVTNSERSLSLVRKILFKDSGELAVTTVDQCDRRQAQIQKSVDRSDAAYQDIKHEINELSRNILIIMVHLNIDAEKISSNGGVKHAKRE